MGAFLIHGDCIGHQMAGGPSKKKFRDAFANCSERVRQYKPFILVETKKYHQKYNQKYHRYRIPFWLMVDVAVSLAKVADKRFDPQRGHDFSTFLRHHLKGLNRFAKRLRRPPKKEIVEEDWERENRKRKCEDARAFRLSWHGRARGKRDGFPELDRLLFDRGVRLALRRGITRDGKRNS